MGHTFTVEDRTGQATLRCV